MYKNNEMKTHSVESANLPKAVFGAWTEMPAYLGSISGICSICENMPEHARMESVSHWMSQYQF